MRNTTSNVVNLSDHRGSIGTATNSLDPDSHPMVTVGAAVRGVLSKLETLRRAALASGDRSAALLAEAVSAQIVCLKDCR